MPIPTRCKPTSTMARNMKRHHALTTPRSAATKAAILNYSRGLAKQVAEKGIRVNIVAPGPIWTALQISGGQTQDKIPQFGQKTPMKRAGQPAELAPVYVYLASQESSYVTAEVHGVCGGEHLG